MSIKYTPNGCKIDLFHCKTLQKLPKF
jgi:hypothetical protein